MRKLIAGSVALAAVSVVAVGAAAATQGVSRHPSAPRPAPATSTTKGTGATSSTTASTSTSTSTTSTTQPRPVDPMAGVAMLGVRGRKIMALDAQGNVMRTLVTAYAGRTVLDAQMQSNHHTIWYVTASNTSDAYLPGQYHCTDVVRLDLVTSQRTVIAHADAFSVTPDGTRVVLQDVQPDSTCIANDSSLAPNVVRDVATGAQSTITGTMDRFVLSPDGRTLVGTHCSFDDDCRVQLEAAALPATLGAPVQLHPINDQKLSFMGLDARADGLYALVDTQPQVCGCGGPVDRYDRDVTVRRLSWNDLGGAGSTLFTVQGPMSFDGVAPSQAGLFAWGEPKVGGPFTLYRLDSGGAHVLRTLPTDDNYAFFIVPMS